MFMFYVCVKTVGLPKEKILLTFDQLNFHQPPTKPGKDNSDILTTVTLYSDGIILKELDKVYLYQIFLN